MTTQEQHSARYIPAPLIFQHWPITIRVTITLIVVMLIPFVAMTWFVGQELNQAELENLEELVRETGEHQINEFNGFLSTIQQETTFFVERSRYRGDLNRYLTAGVGSVAEAVSADILTYIENQFVEAELFDTLYLYDDEGELFLTTTGEEPLPSVKAQLLTSGRNAQALNDTQRLTVDSETGSIVFVRVIYNRTTPLGYMGGTLNQSIIFSILRNQGQVLQSIRSYLTTVNGTLITLDEQLAEAQASLLVAPIAEAATGSTGISSYQVGEQEVVGYFGQVDRNLFLITEISQESTSAITSTDVNRVALVLGAVGLLIAVIVAWMLSRTFVNPIRSLERNLLDLQEGDFHSPVRLVNRADEFGRLGRAFVNVREQNRQILNSVEERLITRTQYVQATEEVSQFAATQRDSTILMNEVASLIVSRFERIAYAQFFLLDEAGEWAVLRAGDGRTGQLLLERGHRLEVGGTSVVGRATGEQRTVVINNTETSTHYYQNPLLPNTRSEATIPLRVGNTIIGALDVQSNYVDGFTEEQISSLETMANQIAIAIENAQLYQRALVQLERTERAAREETSSNWRDFIQARKRVSLDRQVGTINDDAAEDLLQEAMRQQKSIVGETTARNTIPFAVPVVLRGQSIGVVTWELPAQHFNTNKLQLAEAVVNRFALSLENARLVQVSTEATQRERLVNQISALLTSQTDIDEILQTAVREVGQALQVPQVSVKLNLDRGGNGRQSDSDQPDADAAQHNH